MGLGLVVVVVVLVLVPGCIRPVAGAEFFKKC
jgi:hypothetical protein